MNSSIKEANAAYHALSRYRTKDLNQSSKEHLVLSIELAKLVFIKRFVVYFQSAYNCMHGIAWLMYQEDELWNRLVIAWPMYQEDELWNRLGVGRIEYNLRNAHDFITAAKEPIHPNLLKLIDVLETKLSACKAKID